MSGPDREHVALSGTSRRVRGAIEGDRSDLEWTVSRLTPVLIEHARYRLRGRLQRICDPEDVVSHAWQVCLPRLPDLHARDGRYTPVLLRFLGTAVLNRINELLRREIRGAGDVRTVGDPEAGIPFDPVDRAPDVWTEVVRREARGRVLAAFEELGGTDREVIVLRLVEQLPAARVGEKLGLEANAVNVRLHRALGRLRAGLDDSVFDDFAREAV